MYNDSLYSSEIKINYLTEMRAIIVQTEWDALKHYPRVTDDPVKYTVLCMYKIIKYCVESKKKTFASVLKARKE